MRLKINTLLCCSMIAALAACTHVVSDYKDTESPTSGKLRVYYDEALEEHVQNQAATFSALYPNIIPQLVATTEANAIDALYKDSCDCIVIGRDLSVQERSAFASKQLHPSYSKVAQSAVAVLVNAQSSIKCVDDSAVKMLLRDDRPLLDSLGNEQPLTLIFDAANSGVMHYLYDTIVRAAKKNVAAMAIGSSTAAVRYVAEHKNAIAFVDYACLSDKDGLLWKTYHAAIKLLPMAHYGDSIYEPPHQSSIKLGNYPFIRTIYVIKKSGDNSPAKGFESFVMGPKGQITLLKQGLLPLKQQERSIHINTEDQ